MSGSQWLMDENGLKQGIENKDPNVIVEAMCLDDFVGEDGVLRTSCDKSAILGIRINEIREGLKPLGVETSDIDDDVASLMARFENRIDLSLTDPSFETLESLTLDADRLEEFKTAIRALLQKAIDG